MGIGFGIEPVEIFHRFEFLGFLASKTTIHYQSESADALSFSNV